MARRISLGDIIKVEFDAEDKLYYFDDFVEVSGNTTLRVYFNETSRMELLRNQLNTLRCESEVLLQRMIVAVNVPKEVNYVPIKQILDDGEKSGYWTYEESCLAHKY